jgi:hypothetical protein
LRDVSTTTPSVGHNFRGRFSASAGAHQRTGGQSNEAGIKPLTADHRLQEAELAAVVGGQFEVQRQGVSRSAKASTISGMRRSWFARL